MSKKETATRTRRSTTPEAMARTYVDNYFLAHTRGVPSDGIQDDLGATFWDMVWIIRDAVIKADGRRLEGYEEAAGLRASYLLGVEVGRRLGGAR